MKFPIVSFGLNPKKKITILSLCYAMDKVKIIDKANLVKIYTCSLAFSIWKKSFVFLAKRKDINSRNYFPLGFLLF